ncbi:MAG: hypothetical protein M1825_001339 [Sarcosagium campestre]|nr:MAG: hypothetical protein M1825_001339 [Sarcosagium campestre]
MPDAEAPSLRTLPDSAGIKHRQQQEERHETLISANRSDDTSPGQEKTQPLTMINLLETGRDIVVSVRQVVNGVPLPLLVSFALMTLLGTASLLYLGLFVVAPHPRPPLDSEKRFTTILADGKVSEQEQLPCWQDSFEAQKAAALRKGLGPDAAVPIEPAEVYVSLVVPAYNEEERLEIMLEEAVAYLQQEHSAYYASEASTDSTNGHDVRSKGKGKGKGKGKAKGDTTVTTNGFPTLPSSASPGPQGWEVIVVSDGSTDSTFETALAFARTHHLRPASVRVVALRDNRGKGGAVTHGMRHVRGRFAVFADADGASRFSDLGSLISECQRIEDADGRGIAVGSRAHLVGSDAVVKRSLVRNLLMHSFHLLLRLLTPPATASIKDTQCGFKLFSRAALPHIIPHMHSEGWIFDVEMLMLAESANIPVAEVAVGWKEVQGSKLNVVWDSLGMAWGLAVLRAAWGLGVYRRR